MTAYKPDYIQALSPYFVVNDTAKFITFLKNSFDAKKIEFVLNENNEVRHGEMKLDDTVIMFGLGSKDFPNKPMMMYFYVRDVDKIYLKCLAEGAEVFQEPADQFYGDRTASIIDPCGNTWFLATHKKAISAEEIQRLASEKDKKS